MRVPRPVWLWAAGVACIFNVGAGVYAWMLLGEAIHGTIHMLLAIVFGWVAWRMRGADD